MKRGVGYLPAGKTEVQLRLPYCGLRPGSDMMKVVVMQGAPYYLDAIESIMFTVRSTVEHEPMRFLPTARMGVTTRFRA